jgi:hypothetical protein
MRPTPHALWNPADQPARLLEIISPGLERYLADLADILSGLDPRSRAAGGTCRRYGLDVDLASMPRLAAAHGLKVASREVE